ncbi:MAG: hypothetical protein QM704_06280 [Anaeromyxobacteraceae bacterium]
MEELELALVPDTLDALTRALDEVRHRHVAGLEPEPDVAGPFTAHGAAAHRRTVTALREAGDAPLAARVAALRAERAQAEAEARWRALEAGVSVVRRAHELPGAGAATLAELELAGLRERDPERRHALARAAAGALEPAAAAREAAVEARARARAEVGLAPEWPAVVEGDGVLAATDDAWRDVLAFHVREALPGVEPRALTRADLLALLALPRWDGHFRAGMLAIGVRATLGPLGLDGGRVRVDDAGRPAQWPGAHATGARVSFRPRGGANDWQDLFAALGRAHAAAARRPHRREPLLAEAVAWLLASVLEEPRWLAERADVDRPRARDAVRALALRRLFALRADAAALRVATEVERGLSGAAWREAHREALHAATGAAWEGVRASRDGDAGALAARVQGAGAGEALRREVRERFDEDWWRNPRTGPWLGALLADGPAPDPREGAPADAARALAAAF